MTNLKADSNNAEILEKIGLTSLQARIYTALGYSGKEKILTISKIANVDRSNTYRTILQLQNMGLVIKLLGTPNSYEAVPLKEAVSTLVNRKKSEYEKTQSIAQKLIQSNSELFSASQGKEYEFKIVKKTKEPAKEAMIDTYRNLQKSNDYILKKKTVIEAYSELTEEGLACLRRGIKFRVITEKVASRSILKELGLFISEPNFQLRYILKEPEAEIVINDKKVAKITLTPNLGLAEKPTLITDHPVVVKIFQNHFDNLWKHAKEYNLEELKGQKP